jgi:RND family efflux transporter MFP subunit
MRYTLLTTLLIALVACRGGNAQRDDALQPVKCVVAKPLYSVTRDFAALSTADDAVNLAFKLSGRVVDLPIAKGMSVSEGQLLARLDSRDAELQLSATKAAYDEALSRLTRAERLLSHDAISAQEVEALQNGVAQAKAAYENAEQTLRETTITAPFSGVVEYVNVDTYQRVASGETILRLVKPESNTVSFTAPENLVSALSLPTTHYSVLFDAYPDTPFSAVIKSFARTSSNALGFPVSLRLTDVDRTRFAILPGMTCIALVSVRESDSLAVVLPLTAIYAPVGDYDSVWVVDDNNRVERRIVTLGAPSGESDVVVLEGVKAGERVVSAGVYKLTEGEEVKIVDNFK